MLIVIFLHTRIRLNLKNWVYTKQIVRSQYVLYRNFCSNNSFANLSNSWLILSVNYSEGISISMFCVMVAVTGSIPHGKYSSCGRTYAEFLYLFTDCFSCGFLKEFKKIIEPSILSSFPVIVKSFTGQKKTFLHAVELCPKYHAAFKFFLRPHSFPVNTFWNIWKYKLSLYAALLTFGIYFYLEKLYITNACNWEDLSPIQNFLRLHCSY